MKSGMASSRYQSMLQSIVGRIWTPIENLSKAAPPLARRRRGVPIAVALERDLVVEIVAGAGHGRLALARGRAGRAEVGRAVVVGLAAAGAIQHGELRIEALQHDLGGVALLGRLAGACERPRLALELIFLGRR